MVQAMAQAMQQIPAESRARVQPDIASLRAQIQAVMEKQITADTVKPYVAAAYAETFSLTEIQELTVFFDSPTGQAYVTRLPELTVKGFQAGQFASAGARPEINKIVADWAAEMKKKYATAPAK